MWIFDVPLQAYLTVDSGDIERGVSCTRCR
jgi:hypothetical protein